ncbi:HAD family hydrolase [Alkalimonas delamerensis]|uniref:HAD family hydrolase n=1 Tax=Alkalimonas delamerensis TaxID=265981 RepID=A0ABT9GMZ3_9GAMM|nr:HAD family hydrolase [Alkalimonas delamerensis]MDP4528331.1 HAD family hydrolase [Alkalimonas delamerensis]
MIYIFDLDDTLYEERQYVKSGLWAVARFAAITWQLNETKSFETMLQLLDTQGRGRIFDDWLAQHKLATKGNIKACISCYRLHEPKISMPEEHHQLLLQLPKPLYLVTDGNKIVQHKKIQALGIEQYFKRIFITHRFGVKNAKPSTHCFKLIKQEEKCEWNNMTYIGDNPSKDFVNLNKLGMHTVRVLTGSHRDMVVRKGYDAQNSLMQLVDLKSLRQHKENTASM